jgi:hypothetical protein
MRIGGLTGWESPRTAAAAGSQASGGPVGQSSRKSDIENARSTALSALHNDRFRSMLAQIGDSRLGDTLMRIRPAEGESQATLSVVQARYGENSE